MPVVVLQSAKDDLRDGYWFYENQEPGVGDYFSDTHPMTYSLNNGCNEPVSCGMSAAGASVAISGGGGSIIASRRL